MNATPFEQIINFTEITTSVQLNSDRHQLIYASQLYGTFFVVSGKFTVSAGKLTTIEIKLINYSGHINLGMLEATDITPDNQLKRLTIMLELKAMEGKHGHHKSITFKDLDLDINYLDELLVDRKLHEFGGQHNNIPKHLDDKVFDSEFFERDGAVIRRKDHKDNAPITSGGNPVVFTSSQGQCKDTKAFFIK